VALGILKYVEREILNASFEAIMDLMRHLPDRIDAEAVMEVTWNIPLKTAQIVQYENEVTCVCKSRCRSSLLLRC
jgi:hypothetical protein